MKDEYPYKAYYDVVDKTLSRDSYTRRRSGLLGQSEASEVDYEEADNYDRDYQRTNKTNMYKPIRL